MTRTSDNIFPANNKWGSFFFGNEHRSSEDLRSWRYKKNERPFE